VGSFSKTMLPTLRLGFLVAPPSLRVAVQAAEYVTDWHTSVPAQAALARFIDGGGLTRHIRKVGAAYRVRHQMITETLAREFAGHLEVIPSAAGLHVSAFARAVSADQLDAVVRRACKASVAVQELSWFTVDVEARPGLILGYGAISTEQSKRGYVGCSLPSNADFLAAERGCSRRSENDAHVEVSRGAQRITR
jgi:GntR family transcriptional regulator/MocR family aminotransferase